MINHPLIPLLNCPGVQVDLIIHHTGDTVDTETVRLAENEDNPGEIEPCDGLYVTADRNPDAPEKILRRLNLGQLSGTHVFHHGTGGDTSSGFAHWRIELRGDTPQAA